MSIWDAFPIFDAIRTDAPDRRPIEEQLANPRPYVIEGPNHALHFVMSLLTCGLWLPIWLLVAIENKKKIRYL